MARAKKDIFTTMSEDLAEHEVFKQYPREPVASDLFTVPFAEPEAESVPSLDILPVSPPRHHRLTTTQTLLLAAIVLVTGMLGFSVLHIPQPQTTMATVEPPVTTPVTTPVPTPITPPVTPPVVDPIVTEVDPEPALPEGLAVPASLAHVLADNPEEPLSLQLAESFYAQGDFEAAYHVYHQLHTDLLAAAPTSGLGEFLMLRMALCASGLGQTETHSQLLHRVVQSDRPVIRSIARYHQALLALDEGQYLKAGTCAYQALALADAVSPDHAWAGAFRRNCRFLICQATTTQALALHDADGQVPTHLWQVDPLVDPFLGLNEAQLAAFLNQGQILFEKALLGPRIQLAEGMNAGMLWQAVCNGASVDEFLIRFAANAQMDLDWSFDVEAGREMVSPEVRQRPLHLMVTAASSHVTVELAAGCARLFAEVDRQGSIHVVNPDPTVCPSLVTCSQQWVRQAVDTWQRLIWMTEEDQYLPNAHFALGLLREATHRPSEAIAEYRLLADRFRRSKLAPYALLRASRIKTRMADFLGAREDLKILVEQYPDAEFSDDALLSLAQATQQGGIIDDAYRLFARVYNQGRSAENRLGATLGAGQCSFASGRYDNAARWIVTHLDLAHRLNETPAPAARLLLGKAFAAMGQHDKACRVFKDVLENVQANDETHWDALQNYVNTRLLQEKPIAALHVLEGTDPGRLGQDRENEVILMKAKVYRSLGLYAKAFALLNDQLRRIPDNQQRAQAYFEMSACALALEDHQAARRFLSEVLVLGESGPLVTQATYELAKVCLVLGNVDKTLTLCDQVLASQPELSLRKRTLQLLSETYLQQDQLDQAAQFLLEQHHAGKARPSKAGDGKPSDPLVSKNG